MTLRASFFLSHDFSFSAHGPTAKSKNIFHGYIASRVLGYIRLGLLHLQRTLQELFKIHQLA